VVHIVKFFNCLFVVLVFVRDAPASPSLPPLGLATLWIVEGLVDERKYHHHLVCLVTELLNYQHPQVLYLQFELVQAIDVTNV
jgi:hypothetical protein